MNKQNEKSVSELTESIWNNFFTGIEKVLSSVPESEREEFKREYLKRLRARLNK